jgi:NitT/TauT family transport system ATP-binding protein
MSFLTIDDVSFSYEPKKYIIYDVNWEIREGEFHSLLGRSGCGKTTLLKIASGLIRPEQGAVFLGGNEVLKPSSQVGFVFQSPTLLEWKSVVDNVLLPISLKRRPTSEDRQQALSLLKLVGLLNHADAYPTELSGGQQSRVAIARALILKPAMLFLDEPFAALDAITREELQDDLLNICDIQKTTVLFITHDISEAIYLSDHVAVMEKGRLIYNVTVNLPKPRKAQMRYEPGFNELCSNVRKAMSGGMT